jgi:hypothetical protein
MLSDAQAAAIQAIIDNAKSKPSPDAKLKPQTSSSLFGASSGVAPSSGGIAETKARSDAAVAAALKGSPSEILEIWKQANLDAGGSVEEANREFLEFFSSSRKR